MKILFLIDTAFHNMVKSYYKFNLVLCTLNFNIRFGCANLCVIFLHIVKIMHYVVMSGYLPEASTFVREIHIRKRSNQT